jgi:hypothetical protein
VFIGYSPRHKGVKCLDTSTGRINICRDVVFDENVFPFASLSPNVGKRLKDGILLLPFDSPSITSNNVVEHVDDYMPLPYVPNVTNQLQAALENIVHADPPFLYTQLVKTLVQMVQKCLKTGYFRFIGRQNKCCK